MRIAYYIQQFPVTTQTFISREIEGLLKSGIVPLILVQKIGNVQYGDESIKQVLPHVHSLFPLLRDRLKQYQLFFLRRHLLRCLSMWMTVVISEYGSKKNFSSDIRMFQRIVYLAGELQRKNITHIHAPWADQCAFEALLAAKLCGITYSVQARANTDLHGESARFAVRQKLRAASFIITNSEFNRTYIQNLLGSSCPPIHVIYNGLDLTRFIPSSGVTNTPLRMVCVARLIEMKGLTYLLQACAELRRRGHVFQCAIIGGRYETVSPGYYESLKELHSSLNLAEVVSFLGEMPNNDVLSLVRDSDIVVLPSVIASGAHDVTPNTLLEAMAFERAVVSTTITAIPELIENGKEGILVAQGDEKALAHAIEQFILDPSLRQSCGREARKKIERRFNVIHSRQRYRALFESLRN